MCGAGRGSSQIGYMHARVFCSFMNWTKREIEWAEGEFYGSSGAVQPLLEAQNSIQ